MRVKWTKRIYMWYLHIRRHFNDVIFLFCGRHVNSNYLPPTIKFGAFRLKLANKMQESPDRHRQLNCTDTIYVILMTS